MRCNKIVVATDKFKGSMTAAEVSQAIKDGLSASFSLSKAPTDNILLCPMADGGEGSMGVMERAFRKESPSRYKPGVQSCFQGVACASGGTGTREIWISDDSSPVLQGILKYRYLVLFAAFLRAVDRSGSGWPEKRTGHVAGNNDFHFIKMGTYALDGKVRG